METSLCGVSFRQNVIVTTPVKNQGWMAGKSEFLQENNHGHGWENQCMDEPHILIKHT
jgi:hypothetical protein